MLYELQTARTSAAASLFDGWEETIILSCLQGIMGKIYVNDLNSPTAAMAVLGDFIFLAGTPDKELASCFGKPFSGAPCFTGHTASQPPSGSRFGAEDDFSGIFPNTQDFVIMVPQNENWTDMILEIYGSRAKAVTRYATKKEPDIFDREHLEKAAAKLPDGCELCMIDERLYNMCKAESWSFDLVSQFQSYEDYHRLGLGAAILMNNVILSGASSYSRYESGIEIEIDTKEGYRRKGLAYACAAKLILECLNRNLYPSWDAQNLLSVALAQKLGYHYSHSYTAIEVRR